MYVYTRTSNAVAAKVNFALSRSSRDFSAGHISVAGSTPRRQAPRMLTVRILGPQGKLSPLHKILDAVKYIVHRHYGTVIATDSNVTVCFIQSFYKITVQGDRQMS